MAYSNSIPNSIKNKLRGNNSGLVNATKIRVKNTTTNLLNGKFFLTEDELKDILGYYYIEKRVTYVRHGITHLDNNSSGDFTAQGPYEKLDPDGIREIDEVIQKLKRMGVKKKDMLVFFSKDTLRIIQTLQIFKNRFNLDSNQYINNTALRTTKKIKISRKKYKHGANNEIIQETLEILRDTTGLMAEIAKNNNSPKHNILLGHKTNKGGVELVEKFEGKGIKSDFYMKTGSMLDFDINKNSDFINYRKNKKILFVNNENYDELGKIFKPFSKLPITDFQNQINAYFIRNHELFSKYLLDENINNHYIHLYCIANVSNNTELINKFLDRNLDKKTPELLDILKVLIENKSVESLIIRLGTKIRTLDKSLDLREKTQLGNLVGKIDEQFEQLNKIKEESSSNIKQIFENSLDVLLRNNQIKDKKLIERGLVYWQELSEVEKKDILKTNGNDIIKEDEKYRKTNIGYNDIFETTLLKKIIIFCANVGEGKSTMLAKMASELDNTKYIPIFYTSKTFLGVDSVDEIKRKIDYDFNIIKNNSDGRKIIIFFDGIDELSSKFKEEIKKYLINFKSIENLKIIIGSRKFEFDKFGNDKYSIINFETINESNKDEFIINRLKSLMREDTITMKLRSIKIGIDRLIKYLGIETLTETPLILYLICDLAVINKLDDIHNKTQLYEHVLNGIIKKHSKDKGINISDRDTNNIMNDLGLIAYNNFLIKNGRKKETINIPINHDDLLVLNILSDKNSEGIHTFTHNSFYEYFLARYLAKNQLGKEIFKYRESQSDNWNEWKNFKEVVTYYGCILINDKDEGNIKGKNYSELEKFIGLNGLLKNDDIYGDGFIIGYEILYNLRYLDSGLKGGGKGKFYKKLIELYKNELLKLDNEGLLNRLQLFQENQKYIHNSDDVLLRTYAQLIVSKVINDLLTKKKSNLYSYELERLLTEIAKIPTIEFIAICNKYTKDILKKNPKMAANILSEMAKNTSHISSKIISDNAIELLKKKDGVKCAKKIFTEMAKNGNIRDSKYAYRGAVEMLKKNMPNSTIDIIDELIKIGLPEGIEYANNLIDLINDNWYSFDVAFSYLEYVKAGNMEYLTIAFNHAMENMEKNDIYTDEDVENFFIALARIGTHESIELAYLGATEIIKRDKLSAGGIFLEFAKIGTPRSIELAYKYAIETFNEEEISYYIFEELEKLGTPESIKLAHKGFKLIANKENGINGNYYDFLLSINNDISSVTINNISKFMKEISYENFDNYEFEVILLELITNGRNEFELILYESLKKGIEYINNLSYNDIYFVRPYKNILKLGNEKGKVIALKCANELYDKGKYFQSIILFSELANYGIFDNEKINKCFDSVIGDDRYKAYELILNIADSGILNKIDFIEKLVKKYISYNNFDECINIIRSLNVKNYTQFYTIIDKYLPILIENIPEKTMDIFKDLENNKDKLITKLRYDHAKILYKKGMLSSYLYRIQDLNGQVRIKNNG